MNTELAICASRNLAIATARHWLTLSPLYLDTETTGLDVRAEVIELAIISDRGKVLFDQTFRPCHVPQAEALKVSGITLDELTKASPISEWWGLIRSFLNGRYVITYNADFDMRLLYQSAVHQGMQRCNLTFLGVLDAMQLVANFCGEINPETGKPKWLKLSDAAKCCGIQPEGDLHRARTDAELTRRVLHYVASQEGE